MLAQDVVDDVFRSARVECVRASVNAERTVKDNCARDRESKILPQATRDEDDAQMKKEHNQVDHQIVSFNKITTSMLDVLENTLDSNRQNEGESFKFFGGVADAALSLDEKLVSLFDVYEDECWDIMTDTACAALIESLVCWSSGTNKYAEDIGNRLADFGSVLPTKRLRKLESVLWNTIDQLEDQCSDPMLLGLRSLIPFIFVHSVSQADKVLLNRLLDFGKTITEQLLGSDSGIDATDPDPAKLRSSRSIGYVVASMAEECCENADACRHFVTTLRQQYYAKMLEVCEASAPRSIVGQNGKDAAQVVFECVYIPMKLDAEKMFAALPSNQFANTNSVLFRELITTTVRTAMYRTLILVAGLKEQVSNRRKEGGATKKQKLTIGLIEDIAAEKGLVTGIADFKSPEGHAVYFCEPPTDDPRSKVAFFYVDRHKLMWKPRGQVEFQMSKSLKTLLSHCLC